MYTGKNITAIQSKQWLTDSLIQLLESKPYTSITIKDICKSSDLSRQTFYNIFSSKDEILSEHISVLCSDKMNRICASSDITISDAMCGFVEILSENKEFLASLLKNKLDYIIQNEISFCVETLMTFKVKNVSQTNYYKKAFISGGLVHILMHWFNDKNPLTPQELIGVTTNMLNESYF